MALGRLGAAAAAAALAISPLPPGKAEAQTPVEGPGEFVEVFRAGCLAHLPGFEGSAEAFESLGFVGSDGRFERKAEGADMDGPDMMAELYERTVDAGRGCVLASEVPEGGDVTGEVEALVSELSRRDFRRRDAERGGRRVDAFSWRTDGWEVLVVVLPRVSGMQALNVTVAEAR